LLPGKWYVDGDSICVVNDDGTISVFSTSWEEDRKRQSIEKILEEKQKDDKLKEHYLKKRIQKQKEKAKIK
jgi:hypothetical protein